MNKEELKYFLDKSNNVKIIDSLWKEGDFLNKYPDIIMDYIIDQNPDITTLKRLYGKVILDIISETSNGKFVEKAIEKGGKYKTTMFITLLYNICTDDSEEDELLSINENIYSYVKKYKDEILKDETNIKLFSELKNNFYEPIVNKYLTNSNMDTFNFKKGSRNWDHSPIVIIIYNLYSFIFNKVYNNSYICYRKLVSYLKEETLTKEEFIILISFLLKMYNDFNSKMAYSLLCNITENVKNNPSVYNINYFKDIDKIKTHIKVYKEYSDFILHEFNKKEYLKVLNNLSTMILESEI